MWWILAACVAAGTQEGGGPVSPPPMAGRAVVRGCDDGGGRAPRPLVDTDGIADAPVDPLVAVGGPHGREGADVTFVVDRSGSMAEGGRMTYVKRAVDAVAAGLRPGDRLNVVVFDNEACVPLEDWVAGRDDLGLVQDAVARVTPRGSTALSLGLHTGYRVATRTLQELGRERRVVLVTDALVTEDDLDASALYEVQRAWEAHHISLWTVGVGQRPDSPLLRRAAELGGGDWKYLGVSEAHALGRR